MARRFSRDPHYMTAKFPGRCAQCGADVPRGSKVFYYPNTRTLLCDADSCSGQAARDFEASRADESFNGGGY